MTSDTDQPDLDEQTGQYLTFILGGEEYGVDILKVQEIIKLIPVTRVPKVSDFIRDIINLRGKVIPIIELRQKFLMDRKED